VVSPIVRLLRLASFVICAIVIVSFAIFVVDQTKTASAHQTEAVSGRPSGSASAPTSTPHENVVHRTIDEASEKLTSPFAGVVSGSSSEWAIRGVKLLLALVVYGFGLGYLARVLRVRV
jgi:hypothetical protein